VELKVLDAHRCSGHECVKGARVRCRVNKQYVELARARVGSEDSEGTEADVGSQAEEMRVKALQEKRDKQAKYLDALQQNIITLGDENMKLTRKRLRLEKRIIELGTKIE